MKKISVKKLTFVGVMAAMIFVCTMFLKIEIPTPIGPVMLKTANALCLIAGMLFGGVYGGLAAGIGSALYDLTNPAYISSAPVTLISFFIMGALCGWVSNLVPKEGKGIMRYRVLGAICGSFGYFLIYSIRKLTETVLLGNELGIALGICSTSITVSFINAVVAVIIALLLIKPLHAGLKKAHIL